LSRATAGSGDAADSDQGAHPSRNPSADPAVLMGLLFWPRGGSAQVVRYLAPALDAAGWPVRLVSGSRGTRGAQGNAETFFAGLDVVPVDYTAALAAAERGADPFDAPVPLHPSYEDRPGAPDRVFAAVDEHRYLQQVRSWSNALAAAATGRIRVLHLHHLTPMHEAARDRFPRLPIVTHLHGTEMLMLEAIARGETRWSFADAWRQRMTRWAEQSDRLVVVSPRDAARASALFDVPPSRIAIVPHGVDTDRFAPRELSRRERLGWFRRWLVEDPRGWRPGEPEGSVRYTEADLAPLADPEQPVLLFVGRFTEPKRLPLLLRAYARARRDHGLRAPLVIWGGHHEEWEGEHPVTTIEQERIDGVFLLGWRGHDELPDGLACADVLVSPSVGEAFGQVFLEAMAVGLPVIAAADGGPLSFVDDSSPQRNGWLVAPDDTDSLVAALVRAVRDPAERRLRGRNGLHLVRTTYSWSASAERIVQLYAEVTDGVPTVG
jgi:glycosyltransferase involved in cell wall biosynthesis